jgi:hypothetical protein
MLLKKRIKNDPGSPTMNPVFLDSVGLIAVWDTDDQWHAVADTA